MPVTSDSFRDPRKMHLVRALAGFFVEGRAEPAVVGEVLALPRSRASEAVYTGQAERVPEGTPLGTPVAAAAPQPPEAKAAAEVSAAAASRTPKEK